MRNSQAKKEENRRLILAKAGRLFRERGIQGVSVADVMQAADMTHGGFYRHFADKDELIVQTLHSVLGIGDDVKAPATLDLNAYAKDYLSLQHRNDPGAGCTFAALGAEAGRGSHACREVMTEAMHCQISLLATKAAGDGEAAQRQNAIGLWASMIGAIVLSRVSADPVLAREILDGTLEWLASQRQAVSKEGTRRPGRPSTKKRASS